MYFEHKAQTEYLAYNKWAVLKCSRNLHTNSYSTYELDWIGFVDVLICYYYILETAGRHAARF